MPIHFGTDGWRAVISDSFTFANLRMVAQAIADAVASEHWTKPANGGPAKGGVLSGGSSDRRDPQSKEPERIVVGFDTRFLSDRFAGEVARVLAANGFVVHLAQSDSPTPAISYAVKNLGAVGGVMITASHNPNGWSGFKLGYDLATTLLPDDIAEMYQIIASGKFPKGRGQIRKRTGIIDAYTKQVLSRIKLARPMKVVVDAGNGTAGPIAPPILRAAGCQVIERFCDLDYSFPNHEPNPTLVEVLEGLGQAVVKNHADFYQPTPAENRTKMSATTNGYACEPAPGRRPLPHGG